jgi:hypothetical protein
MQKYEKKIYIWTHEGPKVTKKEKKDEHMKAHIKNK